MGNKTLFLMYNALPNHAPVDSMSAVIHVKTGDERTGFTDYAKWEMRGALAGVHAEIKLLRAAQERYNEFSDIPYNSTIIIVSYFSPCASCVKIILDVFRFFPVLKARNVRIKVRFENYYLAEAPAAVPAAVNNSTSARSDDTGRWLSKMDADEAYRAECNKSGYFVTAPIDLGGGNWKQKSKQFLLIAQATVTKTSAVALWHINDFDE
ncbi:hypothetical protein [Pseudomonas fluorescens]|uniref:hypothetical protein n=1 Tax=Pseudomonas fluorescens TaxID=294 RepID=UPI003D1EE5B5